MLSLKVLKCLNCLVNFLRQSVTIELGNFAIHPVFDTIEVLGGQLPHSIEWLKILLDRLDPTEVCLSLPEQHLPVVADFGLMDGLLDPFFELFGAPTSFQVLAKLFVLLD